MMEKNDKQYIHMQSERNITSDIVKKTKELTKHAKEKGSLLQHTATFDKFPVTKEVHGGKEHYFE